MKIANVQAVIFDLDGLMVDTEAVAFTAWKHVGAAIGIEVPRAVQESMVGLTMVDSRELLIKHYGDEVLADRVMATADVYYQATLAAGDFAIKPGLFELLDALEQWGIPAAVATSSRKMNALKKLKVKGLVDRFETLVTSDDVAQGKPSPDVYMEAARRLELKPDHCLALEDSAPGIRAAAASGMPVIMIPDYHPATEEDRSIATAVVASLLHVLPMIEK